MKIGVAQSKVKTSPLEVVCEDGSVGNDSTIVLNKLNNDFRSLYNKFNNNGVSRLSSSKYTPVPMDPTILEIKKTVAHLKAYVTDEIQSEVPKNYVSIAFIHVLLNVCFSNGMVPSEWGKVIINPILKSSTTGPIYPLYRSRCITLTGIMYKLYSYIINERSNK